MGMLESWDDAQVIALSEVEKATAEISVLTALIESACLHELRRLRATEPTLVDYVTGAMGLFTQLTPARTARLAVAIHGLPAIESSYGAFARGESSDDRVQFMFDVGPGIAVLEIGDLNVFAGSTLFEPLAKEVDDALGSLVSLEVTRRAGASVKIADLIGSASDWRQEEWLRSVVSALALLRGVRGAKVSIEGVGPGSALAVTAGSTSGTPAYERVQTVPGGTVVNVAMFGSEEDPVPTQEADELIAAIAAMEAQRHEREHDSVDPVTGLADKALAVDGIGAAIRWCERRSLPCAVVVLMPDDTLDDELRVRAMNGLRAELAREMLCHTTPERFVTVLAGHDRSDGKRAAERLRDIAARSVLKRGIAPRQRTFSAGVAVYPDAGTFPALLLAVAEKALNEAIDGGGDRTVVMSAPPKSRVG